MPGRRFSVLVAMTLVAGGPGGRAETIGPAAPPEVLPPGGEVAALGLEALEQLALENNPTLVQAGAQVRISRGKAVQAGLCPNPTVGYTGEQIGGQGRAGEMQGMFFEQSIVTGGKLQLSRAKYVQEARQAELQVLAQRYRVLQSVRLAYYEVLARQRRLELRKQLVQNSQEISTTLTELLNAGQANQPDVLQAKVELQRFKANLQRADRRLLGAWEELTAVAGTPELALTPLQDALDLEDVPRIDRETALVNLLMCSPELRFAQAEVERDRIAVRRERVEPIPNLNIRADTGYNFEVNDTVAGVQIGLRVPLFDQNQGTIMQAQADLARAQAEVARVELVLRKRFAATFTDYESAVILAENYRTEILPNAQRAYELYLDSFQQRRAAWPQVLDAQREYLDLYEEYLDNVLDARLSEARINTFLLEDGLSAPPEPSPAGHRDATPKPR